MSAHPAAPNTGTMTGTITPSMHVPSETEGSGMVRQFVDRMPAWAILYAVIFFPTLTAGYHMAQGAGLIPDLHRQILEETKAQTVALQNNQNAMEKQVRALTKLARGFCLKASQTEEERIRCIEE
jgi:hypothetical protein